MIGAAERFGIQQVHGAVFAGRHDQIAIAEREPECAARTVVEIVRVEDFEIRGREVIEYLQRLWRKAQERLSPETFRRIPYAISGLNEQRVMRPCETAAAPCPIRTRGAREEPRDRTRGIVHVH